MPQPFVFSLPYDLPPGMTKSITLQLMLQALIAVERAPTRSASWQRLAQYAQQVVRVFGRKNTAALDRLFIDFPETPDLNCLSAISEALYPCVEECKGDENVLLYLIEQREVLQKGLVEQWLRQLYPKGPAPLRTILSEGYSQRGFSDFYARKEALILSIGGTKDQWPATQPRKR